jgi:hypothetical protein
MAMKHTGKLTAFVLALALCAAPQRGGVASTNTKTIYGEFTSSLNITSATVIKATPGTVLSFSVQVAGSIPGTINDVTSNAPTAANQIAIIPNTISGAAVPLNWPTKNGILVVPGTGQTVNVLWQ